MFLDLFRTSPIPVTVTDVSDVTPKMRRVTLASETLRSIRNTQPGQFVSVTFPADGAGSPARPRRFTIRDFDRGVGTMALEFVLHGESGTASRWALHARAGDQLVLSKPGRGYAVAPHTRNHILIGDPTFLPAACEILQVLPPSANVVAFFEVADKLEEQQLRSKANLNVRWVHSGHAVPGTSGQLERAVRAANLPNSDCQAWVGGEFRLARTIERHLSGERTLGRSSINAHGYWKLH